MKKGLNLMGVFIDRFLQGEIIAFSNLTLSRQKGNLCHSIFYLAEALLAICYYF
jgi:hypothetical protein